MSGNASQAAVTAKPKDLTRLDTVNTAPILSTTPKTAARRRRRRRLAARAHAFPRLRGQFVAPGQYTVMASCMNGRTCATVK
ncbi:hypothetical protein, partial [Mycobacterium sp.]|uniref:hypothetical protein n=1 Tax=Mycobacterium sp. TaxID=1785 RepID=UPI003C750E42